MQHITTRMTEGGRVVIPAEYRRALGIRPGDRVIMQLEDGEERLFTLDRAIRRAQDLVAEWFPGDRLLSEELIAERRAEAARE